MLWLVASDLLRLGFVSDANERAYAEVVDSLLSKAGTNTVIVVGQADSLLVRGILLGPPPHLIRVSRFPVRITAYVSDSTYRFVVEDPQGAVPVLYVSPSPETGGDTVGSVAEPSTSAGTAAEPAETTRTELTEVKESEETPELPPLPEYERTENGLLFNLNAKKVLVVIPQRRSGITVRTPFDTLILKGWWSRLDSLLGHVEGKAVILLGSAEVKLDGVRYGFVEGIYGIPSGERHRLVAKNLRSYVKTGLLFNEVDVFVFVMDRSPVKVPSEVGPTGYGSYSSDPYEALKYVGGFGGMAVGGIIGGLFGIPGCIIGSLGGGALGFCCGYACGACLGSIDTGNTKRR